MNYDTRSGAMYSGLSLQNPAWGCVRLSNQLNLEGTSVSSLTIQNILIKHGMGSKHECLLKLEEQAAGLAIELTPTGFVDRESQSLSLPFLKMRNKFEYQRFDFSIFAKRARFNFCNE